MVSRFPQRSVIWVSSGLKDNVSTPTGPIRCLAMIISALLATSRRRFFHGIVNLTAPPLYSLSPGLILSTIAPRERSLILNRILNQGPQADANTSTPTDKHPPAPGPPGQIISHGVWLYFRFRLSSRDVEELLFARGLIGAL